MTFTSSRLERNHECGDFILEGKLKKHKVVVPKGPISADTWRKYSRKIDEIEEICEKPEENQHVSKDDTYQETEAVVRRCSVKKIFLRNFVKFTGKHLCQRLFFNKVAGLRLLLEK